jgi:hypothetical protein
MYSTSVGLLLKGYDNKQNQKETIPDERKDKIEPGEDPEDPNKIKPNIIDNLKTTLDRIFKENDPEWK